ncbi:MULTISPECIES: hypothetical protein [Porphyromonas]|uniref:hypothetical protein n=1 Tax=Porphyromonas TaxID=836 RepID=UPI00126A001D|nr:MULTISPECIES: hypothetical protein [Porphyromonas]
MPFSCSFEPVPNKSHRHNSKSPQQYLPQNTYRIPQPIPDTPKTERNHHHPQTASAHPKRIS